MCVGLFLGSVLLVCARLFLCRSCTVLITGSVMKFEIGNCDASSFSLLSRDRIGDSGIFMIPHKLQRNFCFSVSVNGAIGIWIGVDLTNLQMTLGGMNVFDNVKVF